MSVHHRFASSIGAALALGIFTGCMHEFERPRPETLAKVPGQDAWGDPIWGPSDNPLPETFPTTDPVPPDDGWRRVADWNGDGQHKTELFSVDAEWQIVWSSGAREGDTPLNIKAFAIPGDVLVANVSQDGASPVSALHLRGGGTFYLEVDGAGGPWHVAIEVPTRLGQP